MRNGLTRPRAERKAPKRKAVAAVSRVAEVPREAAIQQSDAALAALAAVRVAIENVSPEIDGGRFPAKAAVGDAFVVEADIFSDGHDKIDAAFLIRRAD